MAPSHSNETKELRINPPTHFTGNRDDLDNFIQDCTLYLTLNRAVYKTDEKQIIFMLSYMTEGTARAWKEAFVRDVINTQTNDFGSIKQFTVDLKKAFEASNSEGDARAKLRQLNQGKDSVDDYVAQFRILAGKARMTDNAALTEYFMEGINTGILQKIFAQEKLPATITEWYERTSRSDSHYRRVQEILGRRRGTSGNAQTTNDMKKPFIPRFTSKEQDPNAMDVDRLSTNERTEHVAKGQWFKRHEEENLARNRKGRRTETEPEIWTVQKNGQNCTGTEEHSHRHGPRRKKRSIRRHIRRKFYRHNGHTQNFLSDYDRFKDEIYACLYSYRTQDNQRKQNR